MNTTPDNLTCNRQPRRSQTPAASSRCDNGDETAVWFSLLQTAQAVHGILENGPIAGHRLPTDGWAMLRCLPPNRPRSLRDLAGELGISLEQANGIAAGLCETELVRLVIGHPEGTAQQTVQGSPRAVTALRRQADAQQELVGRAFKHVDARLRGGAAAILRGLTRGLTADTGPSSTDLDGRHCGDEATSASSSAWHSLLLELSRATIAALDVKVRAASGLPSYGLNVLRRLWWTGAQSADQLADAMNVPRLEVESSLKSLAQEKFIRPAEDEEWRATQSVELTGAGIMALRRTIERQRHQVRQTLSCLSEEQRLQTAPLLEQLSYGLVRETQGYDSDCADCWAGDRRACVRTGRYESCQFRRPGNDSWAPVWEEASLRLLTDAESATPAAAPQSRTNARTV